MRGPRRISNYHDLPNQIHAKVGPRKLIVNGRQLSCLPIFSRKFGAQVLSFAHQSILRRLMPVFCSAQPHRPSPEMHFRLRCYRIPEFCKRLRSLTISGCSITSFVCLILAHVCAVLRTTVPSFALKMIYSCSSIQPNHFIFRAMMVSRRRRRVERLGKTNGRGKKHQN